jgi:pimeloyl-ACP methyl ester carboxylesterase
MGGYAAFELWRQAPDRIAALVLANTRARGDTSAEKAARADLRTQVENAGVGILPMAMLGKLLSSTAPTGAVEFVRNAIGRTTPPAIGQALEALAGRTDSTALLSEITCPVLVIAGSDDEITGTGEVHSMAEAMRGARIVEIQGAGHLSNLESPGPFSDALESFLESALTG